MLKIETNKEYLIFPSWLKIAYSWEDIPAMIEDPLKYDESAKWDTKEKLEGYGYYFDGKVDLLSGPCGGGIMVPHLPEGKRWGLDGALTFDKGADIRDLRYFEADAREFYCKKLNVVHLALKQAYSVCFSAGVAIDFFGTAISRQPRAA